MSDKKDTKETIQDILTKQLSNIADEVVKNLEKETEKKDENLEKKADVEKKDENLEKKADVEKKDEASDAVTKQLTDLSNLVKTISDKLDKIENPDAEILKQKDEIVAKAIKLAKEMGIKAEDVDIEFKIMEKKKSESEDDKKSDEEFEKKHDVEAGEDDLEKEMDSATPEERKEALNKYMRNIIK